jgi:replicative DNA helicase
MIKRVNELIQQSFDRIQDISNEKIKKEGILSGIRELDELTSGWQPSDLIIIGARPGMNKSAFLMSMVRKIVFESSNAVAVFSLKISSSQLINQLISAESGINPIKIKTGNVEPHEWEQLHQKTKLLMDAPLYIDDTKNLSIFELFVKVSRLVLEHNVKLIAIDYLQLLSTGLEHKSIGKKNSMITKNLKLLAKEFNIPIIVLSQLSDEIENRGGSMRPHLSDLCQIDYIEGDVDIVSFFYRPEFYGHSEWDDDEGTSCDGQAELIVAKNNNGGVKDIRFNFSSDSLEYSDL